MMAFIGEKARNVWEESKPYVVMTVAAGVFPSVFMVLLQFILAKGINALVFVVYQNLIGTLVLLPSAIFLEKERPQMTLEIVCYSFLLGMLRVTLCQMLLSLSLPLVGATYQSIVMNTGTLLVFVLAVIFGAERLEFWSTHGQAKMWGVVVSAIGAVVTSLWNEPPLSTSVIESKIRAIGFIMLAVSVLAGSLWTLLLAYVTRKYPAHLSLAATMSLFGTIQAAFVATIVVPRASWNLNMEGGLVLLVILYGGIAASGIVGYVLTWCVHKKGSVFTAAFSPLVIVFTFLLETSFFNKTTHLGSVVGGVLVVVGLYIMLWGKAYDKDEEEDKSCNGNEPIKEPLI